MRILLSTPPSRAIGPTKGQRRLSRRCGPDHKSGSSSRSPRKNHPGSTRGDYLDRHAKKRFVSPGSPSAIKRHRLRCRRILTREYLSENWRAWQRQMWKLAKNIDECPMRAGRKDAGVVNPGTADLPSRALLVD